MSEKKINETTEPTTTETALAVSTSSFAIMNSELSFKDIITENLGGSAFSVFDLDTIKVPTAGGTSWEIPTLEGTESTKTLEGVIVGKRTVRSFFNKPFDGSGEPPLCASQDGEIGYGDPLEKGMSERRACSNCPMNQWGSDPKGGKGKACTEKLMLFVLRETEMLPSVVVIPPSSLKVMSKYFLRLAGKGRVYHSVITSLALAKVKNATGIAYAEVVPSVAGELSAQESAATRSYHESLSSLFATMEVPEEVLSE